MTGKMQPEAFARLFDVSRETQDRLAVYYDLLLKWQKAINLVGLQTLPDAWRRHFADSAQISALIPKNQKIADLGSGGGFPGLVLAVMRPDLDVHLIESDERKAQFLRTVSRETQAGAIVHTARVEDCLAGLAPAVVTARALASLEDLLAYCLPCAAENPQFTMVFLKGRHAAEELASARKNYVFSFECTDSITDPEAQIIQVQRLSPRTPAGS